MTETSKSAQTIAELLSKATSGTPIGADAAPSEPGSFSTLKDALLDAVMNALGATSVEQVNEAFKADLAIAEKLKSELAEQIKPHSGTIASMALSLLLIDVINGTVANNKQLADAPEITKLQRRAELAAAGFSTVCRGIDPHIPSFGTSNPPEEIAGAAAKIAIAMSIHHPTVQVLAATVFIQSAKAQLASGMK